VRGVAQRLPLHIVYSAILVDDEDRTGVMASVLTGLTKIRPHGTADCLADREALGDEVEDAKTIAQQSGSAGASKTDA
jgi:hypothetical protein